MKKLMLKKQPGFDEWLRSEYIDSRKTMREIADSIHCSPATVLNQLRRIGVQTRSSADYETTDKQREAWRKLGRAKKGVKLTQYQIDAIKKANTGRRKRTDYEFGGHEKKRDDGYIKVYVPNHPHCTKEGYVMKHILVMESHIGRYLEKGEVVHHKNRVRDDNRIENLQLMTVHDHMSMHAKEMHEMKRRLKNA